MAGTKADHQTNRNSIRDFEQLVNAGPATSGDLKLLGIQSPQDLIGKDPEKLFIQLCELTGVRQDPCVLDVFLSLIDYMEGNPPRPWWKYTVDRKQKYRHLWEA